MKIQECFSYPFKEKSYQINIEWFDNIEVEDIAQSFTLQYPKIKALISSCKPTAFEVKMVLVGLDLRQRQKSKSLVESK